MPVKFLDVGGGKVMLSGDERTEVEAALKKYLDQGAKSIAAVTQVGGTWVAACTPPAKVERLDDTNTLGLSDLPPARRDRQQLDEDGLCSVEEVGFQRIVRGPTQTSVKAKVEEMKQFGATQIGEIEEVDGEWTALCDTAGIQNTGYRW